MMKPYSLNKFKLGIHGICECDQSQKLEWTMYVISITGLDFNNL